MAKWADYCIVARRYNSNKTRIEKVKIRTDTGSSLTNPQTKTKDEIINYMNNGYTFVTATMNSNTNEWNRGADVHKYVTRNGTFIRTDRNKIEVDNLENLPDF